MTRTVLLDDNKYLIQSANLQDRIIYLSEIRLHLLDYDFDSLTVIMEDELRHRQDAFMETKLLSDARFLIGDLFFNPKILSRQLRYFIERELSENGPITKQQLRIRISLSIEFIFNVGSSYVINMSYENDTAIDPWLSEGNLFSSYYTPRLSRGVKEIRNDHHVKEACSFTFPVASLKNVKNKPFRSVRDSSQMVEHRGTEINEVIEHYKRYIDEIMFPCILVDYKRTIDEDPFGIRVSDEEIKTKCTLAKEKIISYVISQFESMETICEKNRDIAPYGSVAVIIHPPDYENKENRFLVFEYVVIEIPDTGQRGTALTAELSSPLRSSKRTDGSLLSSNIVIQ